MRLFEARVEEWGWYIFGKTYGATPQARTVWSLQQVEQAKQREPLKSALVGAVLDPRQLVAYSAVRAAHRTPGPKGLEALLRAKQSPWSALRSEALRYLGARGPKGAAKLVEVVDWNTLDKGSVYMHLSALAQAGDARHAPIIARFLQPRTDECAYVWDLYRALDPKGAAERALDEALGEGEVDFRFAALEVLTQSNDPRRIAVFAGFLERDESEAIKLVLDTAAQQYLVELGEGVLKHLRNPDEDIRGHAMEAVERLKFFAEAKKALRND
jgi:HEAT repeat protein